MAGSISDPKFNLTFKDSTGAQIGNTLVINPKVTGDYEFQLGRVIELKIGSDSGPTAAKINTVKAQENEQTVIPTSEINFQLGTEDIASIYAVTGRSDQTVQIPEGSIDFKLNNRKNIGSVAVAANDNSTVEIPQDFNLVPAARSNENNYVSLDSSGTYTIKVNPDRHIYRINADSSLRLKIDA